MNGKIRLTSILALAALGVSIVAAACSQATPQAELLAPTAIEEQDTPTSPPANPPANVSAETLPPTATPLPPSATPPPTATATLGPAQEGLSAWCLPDGETLATTHRPANPPDYARRAEMDNGALEVRNLPASACVFIYTFNRPAPAGLKLQIYDRSASGPWLTADLLPIEGKPEAVAAVLTHTYIIAPPLWDAYYQFSVVDPAGAELRRDNVNVHRWTTRLCWNGRKPNPLTLRCPLQQDLHPSDPGYGTPFPTAPPHED